MTAHTWHATVCLTLCALVLFACLIGSVALSLAAFVLAVWHAAMVLWALRPRRMHAWCFVINGSRGRLQVAWMTV